MNQKNIKNQNEKAVPTAEGCGDCKSCGGCEGKEGGGCKGGCSGCSSSDEVFYMDEYGELDDIGFPIPMVVIDIYEENIFFKELENELKKEGYEVLIQMQKQFQDQINETDHLNLIFYINGNRQVVKKNSLENNFQRTMILEKLKNQITSPNRITAIKEL